MIWYPDDSPGGITGYFTIASLQSNLLKQGLKFSVNGTEGSKMQTEIESDKLQNLFVSFHSIITQILIRYFSLWCN